MTYIIHQYDPHSNIWFTVKESSNFDDFSMDDQWAFNLILKNGNEYVEEGNTMWSIEWDSNNTGKN